MVDAIPGSTMRRIFCLILLLLAPALLAQGLKKAEIRQATEAVGAVIDDWHLAASESDEERYFGHMAADAVFIGVNEGNRWVRDAFRRWAHPQFEAKQGWSFKSSRRDIAIAPSGNVAWFDETLETPAMGLCNGAGVMVKSGDTWVIAQYALSLPLPEGQAFTEILEVIRVQKLVPKPESKTGKPIPAPSGK